MHENLMTITEVAQRIGVAPKTIMRWEKAGKIKKSRRNWKGWRVYTRDDVRHLRSYLERLY